MIRPSEVSSSSLFPPSPGRDYRLGCRINLVEGNTTGSGICFHVLFLALLHRSGCDDTTRRGRKFNKEMENRTVTQSLLYSANRKPSSLFFSLCLCHALPWETLLAASFPTSFLVAEWTGWTSQQCSLEDAINSSTHTRAPTRPARAEASVTGPGRLRSMRAMISICR